MTEEFCTSPKSVKFYDYFSHDRTNVPKREERNEGYLTLNEFVRELPRIVKEKNSCQHDPQTSNLSEDMKFLFEDQVYKLFSRLVLSEKEMLKFHCFDESKSYTRNLIATDDITFTLILMCWNPNRESPIHDHPCDGCWMRVCEGSIEEKRYKNDIATDRLVCYSDSIYTTNQLAYINDFMGYHQVGNPSRTMPAVTLHLYIPPFQKCKIWLDASKASSPSTSNMCFYTEYGQRVKYSA